MLHILGMGFSHPKGIINNRFIEDLNVGTTEEWIVDKIGIKERHTTLPLDYIRDTRNQDPSEALKVSSMTPTEMGVEACGMALNRAGIKASDIGLVLCNCCTPSEFTPSEGQRIAERLGIHANAYELFTACPAFALHIDYINNFKEESLPDYVLCMSTAALTQNVDYKDRSAGAIWGDGAAAWVISPRHKGKLAVLDSNYMTDPSRSQAVTVDRYGFFNQDGRAVRDFSVRQTVRLVKQLEEKHKLDWKQDIFIGHQANATMLDQITNNRGISKENHWQNVTYSGNQAGAGAPTVIAEHWDEIKPGQRIAVAVVGAGLSWGAVLLEGRR